MKRTIKIVLGVIAGLFLLLLILPFAFKGKIEKLIKEEINKQVNATVDYQSFSLSFLRSFPDINMQLNGLTVVGVGQFEQDTLVDLGLFSLDLDIIVITSYSIHYTKLYDIFNDKRLKLNNSRRASGSIHHFSGIRSLSYIPVSRRISSHNSFNTSLIKQNSFNLHLIV